MSNGRFILELVEADWSALTSEEREVFDAWLKRARGYDLYMLLRHYRRTVTRSREKKTSNSELMAAVRETMPPAASDRSGDGER